MFKPVACNWKCENGFSLFELVIVLIVLAVLLHFSIPYYSDVVDDSKSKTVKFQAGTFSRAVENLHGQAKLGDGHSVEVNGLKIRMNEYGWPANAGSNTSAKLANQTALECQQLWNGVFKNAPATVLLKNEKAPDAHPQADFGVNFINGRICRYELLRKGDERFFFDYDLKTGEVAVQISK